MVSRVAISVQLALSHQFLAPLDTCLPQGQFEKYGWDNHIGARVLHDQLSDQIGLL